MRISSTRSSGRGFTLVEIMAVILLIGLSLGAVLSVGLTREEQTPRAQLRMFANEFRLATGEALLDAQTLGLLFFRPAEDEAALAWRWLRRGDDGWELRETGEDAATGAFHAAVVQLTVDGVPLEPASISRDAVVQTDLEPQVLIYPTREVTPFRLRLQEEGQEGNQLNVDLMGRVLVDVDIPAAPSN